MVDAKLYQKIYEDHALKYGQAWCDHCPGTRWFGRYKKWLRDPVIDLGCGTGDTLSMLLEHGFSCIGHDWIETQHTLAMKIDITEPIDLSFFQTALLLDVAEHIDHSHLPQIFTNMQACDRQVISVSINSSVVYGTELHINRRSLEEWDTFISLYFNIERVSELALGRRMYLCSTAK